jgi:hypothetical protein
VQDRDALFLTCIEKTNTFEIDEIQFLQIQNDWRFAALDFGLHLIQVPESQFSAEPNPSFGPCNPQRHSLTGSRRRDGRSKSQTICNRLCRFNLDRYIVLVFKEFLFGQEK